MSGVRVSGPPDRPLVTFTAKRNADFRATISLLDSTDLPVALTGATVAWAMRKANEQAAALTLTAGNGLTVDANAGTIDVLITAAQHATLAVGDYQYDLILRVGSQTPQLLEGVYRLQPGVAII